MSIFREILNKIFPSNHPAVTQSNPSATATPTATANPSSPSGATPAGTATAPGAAAAMPPVDVAAVLNGMAQKNPEKLNWRTSIVDLMKLVGLDSSLAARKSLAQELHYPGDMGDSAGMNIWLHKQVMQKIAENGGKVPDDLKS